MKKRWFTLIEMLIVIVIIGILAGALIPRIGNARDKAQDVSIQANVNAITSAAMQAIIDGRTPCGANDAIDYAAMSNYWMTDLWADFLCRQVAGDHVVVYTTGTAMNVADNNNCVLASITALAANSQLTDVLAVVTPDGANNDVYCLAQ